MEKISEFAKRNDTTAKALRHYDAIGLLRPAQVDEWTGYRLYGPEQQRRLHWILLLKNLGLSLPEIKKTLDGPTQSAPLLELLRRKRAEISLRQNEEITRRVQIEKLIVYIEKEGFQMSKTIDLMSTADADVREIIKNMPNYMAFLEQVEEMLAKYPGRTMVLFRGDMWHMKAVNDNYGHEAGDRVIAAFYDAIASAMDALSPKGAFGRTHGDEFTGAFLSEPEAAAPVIQRMIDIYAQRDVQGVPKEAQGSRFGCVAGKFTKEDIRKKLELTFDAMLEAERLGKNRFVVREV